MGLCSLQLWAWGFVAATLLVPLSLFLSLYIFISPSLLPLLSLCRPPLISLQPRSLLQLPDVSSSDSLSSLLTVSVSSYVSLSLSYLFT